MKKFFVIAFVPMILLVLASCATTDSGYCPSAPNASRPVVIAPMPIVFPPTAVSYGQFGHGRSISVGIGNGYGYGLPMYDGYQYQMLRDQQNFQRQQQLDQQNYQRQRQLDRQNFQRQMQIDAMNRLRQQQMDAANRQRQQAQSCPPTTRGTYRHR